MFLLKSMDESRTTPETRLCEMFQIRNALSFKITTIITPSRISIKNRNYLNCLVNFQNFRFKSEDGTIFFFIISFVTNLESKYNNENGFINLESVLHVYIGFKFKNSWYIKHDVQIPRTVQGANQRKNGLRMFYNRSPQIAFTIDTNIARKLKIKTINDTPNTRTANN